MKLPLQIMSDYPYHQKPAELHKLVEIFDNRGDPFLLMPLETAQKKKMGRRVVFIILKDHRRRVLLTKKRESIKQKQVLWNLTVYTHVFAGESAEGAARRELKQNFGIQDIRLKELRTLPFIEDDTPLSATVFLAGPYRTQTNPNLEFVEDAMFVDKDEHTGLLHHHPEMFHTLLGWALRSGWIF